ncbi:MAG: GAF domain-containing protein, partial [Anaerolineae bacterium]|nr:GAF domain-containing protein [Anaerolineae bacterium]
IAVEAIQQNFGAEHVQIFLLSDDGADLRFVAGTGAGEMNLLSSLYAVPMSSGSALARSAKTREVIVVRGTSAQQEHQRSSLDFLPTSRSEFIFPVRDQEITLGVIDVQNSRDELISELNVKAMQILINQFSAALQNARLFHEQEEGMLENKRLFLEAQARLRENEQLNQRLTRDLWSQYLSASRRATGIMLDDDTLQVEGQWTQRMLEASRRKRIVRETQKDQQSIALPIELRGEVIGALEIETSSHADYDSTGELMRAVSQRLANSLETARLFEVERDASVQEQRLSDLVTQYQSAATVDELLQITLTELATTLGAEEGSIRLGLMDQVDLPASGAQLPRGGDPA